MEWRALGDEVRAVSGRCAQLLREAPDPAATVPPTTWTVADVGAHLLSLPRRYRAGPPRPAPVDRPGWLPAGRLPAAQPVARSVARPDRRVGTQALAGPALQPGLRREL